jgi:AcrR family transcriptional regulator
VTSAEAETAVAGDAQDTASRLRRAAERLFAEHGVDGVSLRQITKGAGQRNVTAVNYHFGSRDGLLRAVLEHHLAELRIRHRTLVDRYRDNPPDDPGDRLRELADALVMPACAELDCVDGGPEFLRIAAEVVNRSDWVVAPGTPISSCRAATTPRPGGCTGGSPRCGSSTWSWAGARGNHIRGGTTGCSPAS